MAAFDDILKQLPIDDIAKTLGVDSETARTAVLEGGQTIVSGLHQQTQNPDSSAALSDALRQHVGDKQVSSTADIDTADGESILGHIFGGQQAAVAQRLGSSSSTGGGIDFGKLLPILAPIIMNVIANRKHGTQPAGPTAGTTAASGGSPDLGQILGGMLGGGSLGGILGGIFGTK